ncbi:FkbM family methyltransferase [Rhodophyticola sp.]|uniref:FkbM family methyltransferase n=1 Tax=Rhodophyticola sp. TaxID=2680032 RepID=UPI003D2ADD34
MPVARRFQPLVDRVMSAQNQGRDMQLAPEDKLISLLNSVPLPAYCAGVNLVSALRGYKHRVRLHGTGGTLLVSDADAAIHICRRGRHRRYRRGVQAGITDLVRQYQIDRLDIPGGGTFIDCGANVGEMGFWARSRGMRYVAFEPEPAEARCCDLNNFDGRADTHRAALWKEPAMLTFHSKPDTGDGSIFEMDASTGATQVQGVRLDDAVHIDDAAGPNIFKLEAEGAEPEVLAGAEASLQNIDYVAVDCGYERGRAQQHTFVEVNSFLAERGFRLVEAQFRRVTAIYRNTARQP